MMFWTGFAVGVPVGMAIVGAWVAWRLWGNVR